MLRFTPATSGRRFSTEVIHSLLSGQTARVHFSRIALNGETPAELEKKMLKSLQYQAVKGKSAQALAEYREILTDSGKDWTITADLKTQEVVVAEAKV